MNNPVFEWAGEHPRLAAWFVLSVGMVGMLLWFGRDVGLTAFNWVSLVIATVLTAGACIWIISWEDEEEATEAASSESDVSGAGEADPI